MTFLLSDLISFAFSPIRLSSSRSIPSIVAPLSIIEYSIELPIILTASPMLVYGPMYEFSIRQFLSTIRDCLTYLLITLDPYFSGKRKQSNP